MSGHFFTYSDDGKLMTHISFSDIYEYKGFTFEFHSYCGPIKLNKDWEPSKRTGRKFYKILREWDKLSEEAKEETRI